MSDHTQQIITQLRKQQTLAEKRLWWLLRSRGLGGFKFYRQFPIGPFVADFCCRTHNLIVELDGGHHADQKEADEQRTKFLEECGYTVIRFWNSEVLKNPNETLEEILQQLHKRPHPPFGHPLPKGRGHGL